jgi:hypothetical protein
MSRSGYTDDMDDLWAHIRWRGAVTSSIRGKRGQAFLRELLALLDAMPEKRLVAGEFEADGEVCALGVVARARQMDLSKFDPEDAESAGDLLGIANPLAREIMYENDEFYVWGSAGRGRDSPERRWEHMRKWVATHIKPEAA